MICFVGKSWISVESPSLLLLSRGGRWWPRRCVQGGAALITRGLQSEDQGPCKGFQCLNARWEIVNSRASKLQQSESRSFLPSLEYYQNILNPWTESLESVGSESPACISAIAHVTWLWNEGLCMCEGGWSLVSVESAGPGVKDFRLDCLHDLCQSIAGQLFGRLVTFFRFCQSWIVFWVFYFSLQNTVFGERIKRL